MQQVETDAKVKQLLNHLCLLVASQAPCVWHLGLDVLPFTGTLADLESCGISPGLPGSCAPERDKQVVFLWIVCFGEGLALHAGRFEPQKLWCCPVTWVISAPGGGLGAQDLLLSQQSTHW